MVWVAKVKRQSPSVKSELACTAAIVKRGCTVHYLEIRRCGHFLSTNLPLNPFIRHQTAQSCAE